MFQDFRNTKTRKECRDILLSVQEEAGEALFDACLRNAHDDGICVARAAEIIRRDLFAEFPNFEGHFDPEYVHSSVPKSLVCLIRMMLEGCYSPSLAVNSDDDDSSGENGSTSVANNIAQLIRFNSAKQKRSGGKRRHTLDRETPLPIYIGLMVHSKTRKAGLVNKLSNLGVSISYDRVCDIKEKITNQLCIAYNEKHVVIPPSLENGLFTTSAIDNIDHNVTATSAQEHFHGTSM